MSVQTPPLRTPDPLASSRRRALERLGDALRLSPITSIGDIGSNTLSTTEKLTWETAADWDNAVDENGVVHESVANTDHNDDTTIKKGYSAESPFKSSTLELAYLCHEDSGTTMNDFSGTGRDGSYSGPTLGNTGLLGTTAPYYDGSDDHAPTADPNISGAGTMAFWLIEDGDIGDTTNPHYSREQGGGDDFMIRDGGNSSAWTRMNGTDHKGGSISTGTWHFHLSTTDGSGDAEMFLDGSSVNTMSDNWGDLNTFDLMSQSGNEAVQGRMAGWWLWNDRFTTTEVQNFYDTVRGTSYLETATKSFSSDSQPDLVDLDYSLNGQSIDLKVIRSPGTASEEVVTQTLDGSTGYALSWTSSHTDFRLRPELSTADETVTPTFSAGSLTT